MARVPGAPPWIHQCHSPISLPISPNFSKIPSTLPVRRCFIIFLTLSTKIRNASEIPSEILSEITYFGKFRNASEMHHKYLFFPEPPLPSPILKHILFFTHPPPITAPYPQFPHFSTSHPPQNNQICKMQMAAKQN